MNVFVDDVLARHLTVRVDGEMPDILLTREVVVLFEGIG